MTAGVRAALRGLTTRGRALLLAGVVLALVTVLLGQQDLLHAAVFLLVLPLVAVAVVSRTRYLLTCTRGLEPGRVPAGTPTDVHLRLESTSPLPSGTLLMEDDLPYALGGRPRFVLDRVEPRGVRDVAYAVRSDLRGRFRIGPLSVRLTDPFGLVQLHRSFASVDDLVVTPVVEPLPPVRLGDDRGSGGESPRTAMAAGGEDATTREYRRGDDLRRVHWRSTARVGELMVRQEEQPLQQRATLLLDTRASAHTGEGAGASFEWAVSAAASTGVALLRAGWSLSLVSHDGTSLLPPGVPVTEDALLDVLAGVAPGRGGGVERLADGVRRNPGVLVAVLGRLAPGEAEAVARVGAGTRIAVLLDTPTWVGAAPSAAVPGAVLSGAGWRVLPAAAGTRLPDLWARAGLPGAAPRREGVLA